MPALEGGGLGGLASASVVLEGRAGWFGAGSANCSANCSARGPGGVRPPKRVSLSRAVNDCALQGATGGDCRREMVIVGGSLPAVPSLRLPPGLERIALRQTAGRKVRRPDGGGCEAAQPCWKLNDRGEAHASVLSKSNWPQSPMPSLPVDPFLRSQIQAQSKELLSPA